MWKLNENGDLELNNGITEIDKKTNEVAQRLQLKLSLFNGDYELHKDEGIEWFETYTNLGELGKKIRYNGIKNQIRQIIEDDEDVQKVNNLELNYNNTTGNLVISVDILLKNGEKLSI